MKELDNGKKVRFKFKEDDDCIVVAKWYPTGMKVYGKLKIVLYS